MKFDTAESIEKALAPWGEDGLKILPSGNIPPNPVELLNSETTSKVVASLKSHFEFVILDCAPFLPVTDVAIVA